jgi:hypothetical protein
MKLRPRIPSTRDDLVALARRLAARAESVYLNDQPEQQNDLILAALLIQQHAGLIFPDPLA